MSCIQRFYSRRCGCCQNYCEITDYQKEEKTEALCLVKTRSCEDIQTNIENDNYNIWRKDRKGKKI